VWRRRKTNASYARTHRWWDHRFRFGELRFGHTCGGANKPSSDRRAGRFIERSGGSRYGVKDKSFDLGNVSKALVDEASRLSNDAAGWGRKLQELELEFNKNQQDDETIAKNVDETLVVLRAAASRLAPDAEARVTLRKEEGALRELASRAEVHSHPEIRKSAGYFQQKTTELHALNRSVEETRIQLISQIDRLEELKAELEFRGAIKLANR
jgi:hypothetical protein